MTPALVARAFRVVAVAEACSWACLLVGMFVKWILRVSEIGVQVFGPIHGGLFVRRAGHLDQLSAASA